MGSHAGPGGFEVGAHCLRSGGGCCLFPSTIACACRTVVKHVRIPNQPSPNLPNPPQVVELDQRPDGPALQDTLESMTVRGVECRGSVVVGCVVAELAGGSADWGGALSSAMIAAFRAAGGMQGKRTVPIIFLGGSFVGGADDLSALEASGQLDARLRG